jgi:hypothetical protein
MLLAKEYLVFFKEFFSLEEAFAQYYPKLMGIQNQLEGVSIREDYRKKIEYFILKECRELAELSKRMNIEVKLQAMKERIEGLEDSYLEEVIAKIALHAFAGYDQLSDMKYKLKVRIKNIPEDTIVPHLYKYYYDYVLKMARAFKLLDEELPIREVLNYIVKHDSIDFKYRLELVWFEFSMKARTTTPEQRAEVSKEGIREIQDIFERLEPSLQSSAVRRLIVLKLFGGDSELEKDVQRLLDIERSFENLQCASSFFYCCGRH